MKYEINADELVGIAEPESGEVIEITRKSKVKEPLPPFNMIGNGFSNRYGTSLDFIEVCLELNQSELRLLQFFRNCYAFNIINQESNTNEITPTRWETYTDYLKKALEKNYKHLVSVRALVRVRRGTYLINPNLFVPLKNFGVANALWISLIDKEDNK